MHTVARINHALAWGAYGALLIGSAQTEQTPCVRSAIDFCAKVPHAQSRRVYATRRRRFLYHRTQGWAGRGPQLCHRERERREMSAPRLFVALLLFRAGVGLGNLWRYLGKAVSSRLTPFFRTGTGPGPGPGGSQSFCVPLHTHM